MTRPHLKVLDKLVNRDPTSVMPPKKKTVGYSGTSLVKKLGIKPEFRIAAINPPEPYERVVEGIPTDTVLTDFPNTNLDFIHFFTKSRDELKSLAPKMIRSIKDSGMIWVSWPKKSSKVPTDITEDTIRAILLPLGLVDIKVCAVDEVWSGLKMVIRKENRKGQNK